MKTLMPLLHDDHGFIVSAELVLIATLLVIGLIVGLSEVQHAVVSELNDVGEAIGSANQSFKFSGFASFKSKGREVKAIKVGSEFRDARDDCDGNECDLGCAPPKGERGKGGNHWH